MKPWKESKRGTTKTKVGEGGEATRRLLQRKNTYIMKKEQIQMHKKERKKNEVMSNILYVTKANICLYVYIFITNEIYVLQLSMYLYS